MLAELTLVSTCEKSQHLRWLVDDEEIPCLSPLRFTEGPWAPGPGQALEIQQKHPAPTV